MVALGVRFAVCVQFGGIMGLFDQLAGAVAGGLSGGGDSPLAGIMGMAQNPALMQQVSGLLGGAGGIGGLVEKFAAAGLGDAAQSWVSAGPNQAVSAADLHSVFGADKLGAMAQAAGIDLHDLTGMLAKALPALVDHATPGGAMPQSGGIDLAGLLGGLMKG